MGNCILFKNPTENKISETNIPPIFITDITNIPRHSYNGEYKYVVFDHIYDGDTADIYFYDNDNIIRNPFRFYGYDSAEIKPLLNTPNRELVIKQAQDDREFLRTILRNNYLVAKFMPNEKYGRMMGQIWRVLDVSLPEKELSKHPELIDNNQINLLMINSKHGKPYFGGKKG